MKNNLFFENGNEYRTDGNFFNSLCAYEKSLEYRYLEHDTNHNIALIYKLVGLQKQSLKLINTIINKLEEIQKNQIHEVYKAYWIRAELFNIVDNKELFEQDLLKIKNDSNEIAITIEAQYYIEHNDIEKAYELYSSIWIRLSNYNYDFFIYAKIHKYFKQYESAIIQFKLCAITSRTKGLSRIELRSYIEIIECYQNIGNKTESEEEKIELEEIKTKLSEYSKAPIAEIKELLNTKEGVVIEKKENCWIILCTTEFNNKVV